MLILLAAIQNPPAETGPAAGSTLWQLAFISFACVLILLEVLRGWRRGLPRQLVRLVALVVAYFVAYFCGGLFTPVLRSFIKMPNAVLSIVAAAALALIIYFVINTVGTMLFRRTGQHDSLAVRILYGTTGAFLGLFFGTLLVWFIVVGVRAAGSVADARVQQQSPATSVAGANRPLHAVDVRRRTVGEPGAESDQLLTTLSRLKNSLELGAVGDVVKKNDPVPAKTYETLRKVGLVVADPESVQRFLSFPGAQELAQHSKIVALRNDQEIVDLITHERYLDLLQNQKVLDAANDPELAQDLKGFKLEEALDYALKRE